MSPHLTDFVSGLITMGFLTGALFFARFWSQTKDALFAVFALAFALLAAGQALTTLISAPLEEHSWIFLIRLTAFSLLIAAILQKNLSRPN